MLASDVTPTSQSVPTANGADGREAQPKFWIAAYTRPNSERKAADALAKAHIEAYVPSQVQLRRWSDRMKKVEVMVIPRVIFARITKLQELDVRKQPLILSPLSLPGQRPAARIPDTQIQRLRFMLGHAEAPVQYVAAPRFKATDPVRVIRGPLRGLTGQVAPDPNGRTRLYVTIDLLGGVTLEVDPSDIIPHEEDGA